MKVKELAKYTDSELQEIAMLSKIMNEDIKPLFDVKPFINMEYGQVLQLKSKVQESGSIDSGIIIMVADISGIQIDENKMLNSPLKKYFRTANIIEDEYLKIQSYEEMLNTETDTKLINAGIEDLNQFGDLNIIDALAKGDILKWEAVLKLQWWDVFNKLLKTKVENTIQKTLQIMDEAEHINRQK